MSSVQHVMERRRGGTWVFIVIGAAALGIGAVRFPVESLALIVVAIAAFVFYERPLWGYTVVVAAATLTHFRFATPLGHWRLEQVASTLGLLAYVRLRRPLSLMNIGPVASLFLMWVAINGVSSIFAPEWFQSEKIVLWLLTDVFALLLTREVARCYGIYAAFVPFWIAGVLAVSLGIGLWLVNPLAHQGRAMGFMQEPDVFGTFSAMITIYGLTMLGSRELPRILKATRYLGVTVGVVGVFLSATRSSLIGLVCALIIAAVMERARIRKVVLAGLAIGSLCAWGLEGSLPGRLSRLSTASTLAYRMIRVKLALHGIVSSWTHFILGHGTNSYGQFHLTISSAGLIPDYLGVQMVTVPYDTGLLGTIGFAVFLVVMLKTMWRNRTRSPVILGSVYALIAMLVAYQATNGIWFGFTWIVVALGCSDLGSWPRCGEGGPSVVEAGG